MSTQTASPTQALMKLDCALGLCVEWLASSSDRARRLGTSGALRFSDFREAFDALAVASRAAAIDEAEATYDPAIIAEADCFQRAVADRAAALGELAVALEAAALAGEYANRGDLVANDSERKKSEDARPDSQRGLPRLQGYDARLQPGGGGLLAGRRRAPLHDGLRGGGR